MNDNIYDSGAVGLSLTGNYDIKTNYDGFEPQSEPISITSCKGNIILSLDFNSASEILIKSTEKRLKTWEIGGSTELYARITTKDGFSEIFTVIGGDVSKCTIALDTTIDLLPGMKCQVYHYNHSFFSEMMF
jgi:WD40 repeat protein